MNESKLNKLTIQYTETLRGHLLEPSRTRDFLPAQQLGRQAVAIGLETLDLAKIHDEALSLLIPPGSSEKKRREATTQAAAFFTEAIEPIERTHPLAKKAHADLTQMNAKLVKRTSDLAKSNKELKEGVAQRLAAVKTLKSSEDNSRKLLNEASALQLHLQDLAHQMLASHEDERRKMSLKLQDEIAQTLVAIHLRLVELDKELTLHTDAFKKEIANTQRLVEESVGIINGCAHEFGIVYEN